MPRLTEYEPADRPGFADLVDDVHAEFGFAHHQVLDADLAEPEKHYEHLWVVKDGDAVVGSVALTAAADGVVTLKRLYLRPEVRGHGWGRRLLEVAVETAERAGRPAVVLDTDDRQPGAWHLFEAAGFVVERRAGSTRYYRKDLTGAEPR